MQEIKKERLLKMLDKSNRAFLIYKIDKPIPFYANKQAIDLYGDSEDVIHVYEMFETKEATPFLKADIRAELKKAMSVTMYDIATVTNKGEIKISDLQIGYNDDEKTTIFIELSFKEDNRMEIVKNQIYTSNRAEAVINYDEKLTLLHCNSNFFDIFESSEMLRAECCKNSLVNGFAPENREEKLAEILEGLKHNLSYTTQVKIITYSGKKVWYSLDLQRRILDDTGEKLMLYMVCIENQVKIADKLEDISEMFNVMQSLSSDILYRINVETKVLYRNEVTAKLYNIPSVVEDFPTAIGKTDFVHQEDMAKYIEFLENVLTGVEGSHIARIKSPSGNYEFHKFTFKKLLNSDGKLKEMIGKVVNIQELIQLEEKASFDLLTNTLNKISFEEQTKLLLSHTKPNSKHALIFIDLDDFKGINDNLGHSFGDFLLKNVGIRLRKLVREGDLVGRVGGDEFIIFLENRLEVDKLVTRCERILNSLQEDYIFENNATSIKGSIGMALYPEHGVTYEELYSNADTALYKSKGMGKNVITIFSK